jgi:hypothetical protein
MLLFVFTVSIPNRKPMPQVQITESVSRRNNGTAPLPAQTLALLCILQESVKELFNQRLNCSHVTKTLKATENSEAIRKYRKKSN